MTRIWNKHKLNTPLKRKVFVGMSGGVDSSVTAVLLKERGFDVRGVHIKMWSDESIPCQFKEDRRDALRVAEKLGIPFETWDLTDEYREEVVHYMIREYAMGRTPNPDIMCNRKIKFGVFLARALERGADFVATGHYARVAREFLISPPKADPPLADKNQFLNKSNKSLKNFDIVCRRQIRLRWKNSLSAEGRSLSVRQAGASGGKIENCKLRIAKDLNKDQSYFLWTLTQEQLKHVMFPLGEYTKPEVREMARHFGLSTAEKPDSQGICFIGEIDLNNYLKRYIPEAPGRIVTTAGDDIGEHSGLAFYTIGQREGLGIGGGIPYYVAQKDFQTNTLVVAKGPFDEKLFLSEVTMHDVHWISGIEPSFPLQCTARIRYRQFLQKCTIQPRAESRELKAASLKVSFREAQRAVTPGQSIVFYQDDEMLGGACIS